MLRRNPRADIERVSQVLAGIDYPAAKWQLIMHAEEYGADAATRADLWGLAPGGYPTLAAVLQALGIGGGGRRPRAGSTPVALRDVAGRPRPAH